MTPPSKTHTKKILAIKLRSLGDTVLMTSALEELHKGFPKAEIHVALTSNWIPILEKNPHITQFWKYERRKNTASRAKAIARLGLKLRKENYDLVVNFHASPSSAILAFATGAKTRSIHFHGAKDKNRYSTVTVPGKGVLKPIIERDMDAVRALGLNIPEGRTPKIYLDESETNETKTLLEGWKVNTPVLAMGLGASRPTKIWPLSGFAKVAEKWRQETGGTVIAITSPDENRLRDDFLAAMGGQPEGIHAPRNLELRQTASLLQSASLFIGNDSGPKHIAVAVGTPTLTLIGPEDPFEWHPYENDLHPYLHIRDLECRQDALPGRPPWCGLERCTVEKHKCMTQIAPEDVFSRCKELLKRVS